MCGISQLAVIRSALSFLVHSLDSSILVIKFERRWLINARQCPRLCFYNSPLNRFRNIFDSSKLTVQ